MLGTIAACAVTVIAVHLGIGLMKNDDSIHQKALKARYMRRYSERRPLWPPGGTAAALYLVNRHVTMARGRAVRVADESVTIVYARPNRTYGRVTFDTDAAFDEVCEGDLGVLIIVEQTFGGTLPIYKFIRDADIPTIDDVLSIGTGDSLTDQIYEAARSQWQS